jgi:hypothetical protein
MRFAAIADVHGNYLALEAVIADIRAQDITDIVNLGIWRAARSTPGAGNRLDSVSAKQNGRLFAGRR